MKYFLPSYEQCQEIVNTKGELIFYESKYVIDGFNVSLFNYRLPLYVDFFNPVNGVDNSKELRGLAFVFNNDGTLYKRFLMLTKFWNLNQVTESFYDNVKNLKIQSSYNKEDGSLISFIELPNGRIVARTKMGFDNDQTVEVNKLFTGKIEEFVKECFDNDLVPFFEYVSFRNKIVLNYKDTELILLRVRNNNTGEFLDVEQFRNRGFKVVESEGFKSLDEIIELYKTLENKEGSVITFENGQMIKIKTDWYFVKHKLNDDIHYENAIIDLILNEKIDDVLCQLNEDTDAEKIEFINNIEVKVNKYIKMKMAEVEELVSKYNGVMKDFALAYLKNENFGMAVNVLKGKEIYSCVKEYVLKSTDRLLKARTFLEKITV